MLCRLQVILSLLKLYACGRSSLFLLSLPAIDPTSQGKDSTCLIIGQCLLAFPIPISKGRVFEWRNAWANEKSWKNEPCTHTQCPHRNLLITYNTIPMDKIGVPWITLFPWISVWLRQILGSLYQKQSPIQMCTPLWSLLESVRIPITYCSGPIDTAPALVCIDSILHAMHSLSVPQDQKLKKKDFPTPVYQVLPLLSHSLWWSLS